MRDLIKLGLMVGFVIWSGVLTAVVGLPYDRLDWLRFEQAMAYYGPPPGYRGGPDAFGYINLDDEAAGGPAYVWQSIGATGTAVSGFNGNDDGYAGPFEIGFSFPLYDRSFSRFYVGTNGYLTFDGGAANYSSPPARYAVMPFLGDQIIRPTTQVSYQLLSNPIRLVVQYDNLGSFGGEYYKTFQVVLYPSGNVAFYYQSVAGSPVQVGIRDASGVNNLTYPSGRLRAGRAILFQRPPGPAGVWQSAANPANGQLFSIAMVSATEGWAVGDYGTILHYVNGSWQSVFSPTSYYSLLSIAMISATEGWAVGDYGTILHYVNGSWQSAFSPTSSQLRSIVMVSATEGWAVGGGWDSSCNCYGGRILHFTDGSWKIVASPASALLYGVAMVSASEGWAVGDYGTILHYNYGSWQGVYSPAWYALHGIAMDSASEGWAVGAGGTILHYTNGNWQSVSSPTNNTLYGAAMVSATEGWAVGTGGTILYYVNGSWQRVLSPAIQQLYAPAMVSSSEGWAVGDGTILHYTVGTGSPAATSTATAVPPSTATLTATATRTRTSTATATATSGWQTPTATRTATPTAPAGPPQPAGPVPVSNVTDNAFTLSWTTPLTSTGSASVAPAGGGATVNAVDVRGSGYAGDAHYVRVVDLMPSTVYSVSVYSGDALLPGGVMTVTTGPTIGSIPAVDALRGYLYEADGWTPAGGAIVYLRAQDADGQGSAGSSALLSALVTESGAWLIDLPPRRQDLGEYFAFGNADRLLLTADAGRRGAAARSVPASSPRFLAGLYLVSGVSVPVQAGWTLLALPSGGLGPYTAAGLLGELAAQGLGPRQVVRWRDGQWQSHIRGFPANDFDLEPGSGYFVWVGSHGAWQARPRGAP